MKEEINKFIFLLSDYDFSKDLDVDDADRSATNYYAGYIVRSFSRAKSQCEDCFQMLSGGLAETTSGDFTGDFTAAVSRGGLLKPSDLLLMTSLHACSFWSKIRKDEDLRKMLLATTNPKEVFVGCLVKLFSGAKLS